MLPCSDAVLVTVWYYLVVSADLLLDLPLPDIHRMASCTCWTATSVLNQNQSAFRTAKTNSTWSSPVKRESMTKCWRVRPHEKCVNWKSTAMISHIFQISASQRIDLGFLWLLLIVLCRHYPGLSLDLNSREEESHQPVHVINVDIQDNHEEATVGAFLICELCQCVSVFFHQSVVNHVQDGIPQQTLLSLCSWTM